MDTGQKIHIGILSPATADRPHFKSLEQIESLAQSPTKSPSERWREIRRLTSGLRQIFSPARGLASRACPASALDETSCTPDAN
jgi:hypothetical protein